MATEKLISAISTIERALGMIEGVSYGLCDDQATALIDAVEMIDGELEYLKMPKNVKCKTCNNLVNHWCERIIDSPDEDMERDCTFFWERTNADRIRAMTDEELASIMIQLSDLDTRIGFCRELPECKALLDTEDGIPASMCEECMRAWLKQPAEVDYGQHT